MWGIKLKKRQNWTLTGRADETVRSFLTSFRITVVLLVLFGNPDFYDSGSSGSLAIIVLVPRSENNENKL